MRFNKLDLNLLVALDAMLAERNISRAAERMHMTQSAMSNALSRLRHYFDDELLVQVGRRMDLTPRAEALQDIVRDVLVRVDAGIATVPTFDAEHAERQFTLSVSDFTLQTLMPHVLELGHRRAPGVRFNLVPQVHDPGKSLERGEVDLLVIPEAFCSNAHPVETIFEEELRCVVWSGSRWAKNPITVEQFREAGHVVVMPDPHDGRPAFDGLFFQRYGVARKTDVTTFSFTSVPFLVLGTDRIGTVHKRMAMQASRLLPLAVHPMPMEVPVMRQNIQWHKYRSYDPGLMWIVNLFREAATCMNAEPISVRGIDSINT